jgi:Tol biopolymer transport system component
MAVLQLYYIQIYSFKIYSFKIYRSGGISVGALLTTLLLTLLWAGTSRAQTTEPVRLTWGPERESAPVFSPDGHQILYIAAGKTGGLYLMNTDGTAPLRLTTNEGQRAYWSPLGQTALYGGCGWDVVGVQDGALLHKRAFNCLSGGRPAWSPDGGQLAVLVEKGAITSEHTIEITSVGTDLSNVLPTARGAVQHFNRLPTWAPSGQHLAYASSRIHGTTNGIDTEETVFVVELDGGGSRSVITYRWLTQTPASPQEHNRYRIKALSWSPDGTRLGFIRTSGATDFTLADGIDELFTVGADGSAVLRLSPTAGHINDFSWSPDGKRVVFDLDGDLYVVGAQGSNPQQLTLDPANDILAHWSPDGKRIVFESSRSGDGDIYLLELDGSTAVSPRSWGAVKHAPR